MIFTVINELWEDLLYEAREDFKEIKPDSVNVFYGILQGQTQSFLHKVKQVLESWPGLT